jgi:uncharacterized protein (DUF885 family)
MRGVHAQIPALLINVHKVDNEKDARAYIARLDAIPKLFDQVIVNLRRRAKAKAWSRPSLFSVGARGLS